MADSEVRQKFEAFAKLEMGKYPSLYDLPDPFKIGPEDEYFEDAVAFAWAAYEAGEIAQQEKIKELAEAVAKEVGGQFWETHMLNTGLLKFLARLPLSGAEEAKKENG